MSLHVSLPTEGNPHVWQNQDLHAVLPVEEVLPVLSPPLAEPPPLPAPPLDPLFPLPLPLFPDELEDCNPSFSSIAVVNAV
jgi:hypothetical protein